VGEHVAKVRTDLMKEQLATFRSQLEDFARKHKVGIWCSVPLIIHAVCVIGCLISSVDELRFCQDYDLEYLL
jgi:hypothetical protein